MGRFKKPVPKTVKCEDCGRLFGKERDLTQHLNSQVHTPVINHDRGTRPNVSYLPVTSDTLSFQSPVPRPMSLDDKPEEVEFPKKQSATPKLYILTPVSGKGQGLIAAQDISKGTRFSLMSLSSGYRVLGQNFQLLKRRLRENLIYSHTTTKGISSPSTIVHPATLTLLLALSRPMLCP
jgi:hypothetical protein